MLVEAGDIVPSDGDVIEGVASVNEAAITGESAPVIRESGGDRSAVTGGTTVISDWIKVRITAAAGHTFLDRMIALVEGAEAAEDAKRDRAQHPARGMTLIFVFAVASIPSFAAYAGGRITVLVLVALFVTLIPTTIGALLSAIGIAGMDRLVRFNVLAMSGRAVEAAGDVDTLLLDKTGTITLGNRQASEFLAVPGVGERDVADAAQLASLSDETTGGPLHRRAGEGQIRVAGRRRRKARRSCRSRRRRASAASISTARRSARARSTRCWPGRARQPPMRARSPPCPTTSQRPAAHRSRSRRTASCWASST